MSFIKKMVDAVGPAGWVELAPIETWWPGDDAIDAEASDAERYWKLLDKSALVVRPGQQPQAVVVRPVSDGAGIMAITEQVSVSHAAGMATAFALAVRFPGIEEAEPVSIGGQHRLPAPFMRELSKAYPGMIRDFGAWVINNTLLSDQEKKASSSGSGLTSSSKSQAPTTAEAATSDDASCKAAPISEQEAGPKQPTG